MSIRLFLLGLHVPAAGRRRMFQDLTRMTASAFGVPPPDLAGVPDDALVDGFAAFTRGLASGMDADGPQGAAIQARLYDGARGMGREVRQRLGIRSASDAGRALVALYRVLGIEVDADFVRGECTVSRCAFSATYTPDICRFMSALDAGIVDGLTGGTTLEFTARLTEGARQCRARLIGAGRP